MKEKEKYYEAFIEMVEFENGSINEDIITSSEDSEEELDEEDWWI